MNSFFPPWPLFSAFLLASLVLAVSPGPGVLYIVARSLVQGRCAGLVSVGGVALGNLGNAVAASVGLAAIFAVSSLAATGIRLAGALYLVYLGLQMLHTPATPASVERVPSVPLRRIFRDGFVVALFNPKTTVFFAAFLPQFMHGGASPIAQSLMLGALFVAIAAVTDAVYALAASVVAPRLSASGLRLGQRFGGGIFVGLGVLAAFSGSRGSQ